METSETISGERERAPVGGVMDSDISNRLSGKKCRVGDFHLASVAVKAVVAARAQWRHFEMRGEIDAQSIGDPSAPFVTNRQGFAFSGRAPR